MRFSQFLLVLVGLAISIEATTRSAFGEACSKEKRCDSKALLTCFQEVCECLMPNTMVFDESTMKCIALAGEKCIYSAVEGDRTWIDAVPCVSNALCASGICTCNPEYFEISNGTCESKRDYKEPCYNGSVEICKTGLTCGDDGHCTCDGTRVYESSLKTCVILAGEKCYGISGEKHCVFNANCDTVCTCQPGFFRTVNATCEQKKGYGLQCSNNDMCLKSSSQTQTLVCGETGYCKCVEGKAFDYSMGLCVHAAGENCEKSFISQEPSEKCVENSYCDILPRNHDYHWDQSYYGHRHMRNEDYDYGQQNYKGKCTCKTGFFKNVEGRCIEKLDYGSSCTGNDNCKAEMNFKGYEITTSLECNNGTCNCNSGSSVYSNSFSYPCLSLVGYSCTSFTSLSVDNCVTGSFCEYKRCTCPSYFYTTEERKCSPKKHYGGKCNVNHECREDLQLSCNSSQICDCNSDSTLHPISKLCLRKAGKNCKTTSDCVPNSICKNLTCFCDERATQSLDGYCNINEDMTCDSDLFGNYGNNTKTCLPGLHCFNDTCSCLHKDHQVYKASTAKCTSLINGPCETSEDCVENSDCVDTDDGIKICQCKTGFTPVERQCDLAYGQQCHQNQSPPKCDRLAPLGCSVRGLCECLNFQVYDNSTLSCRGLVGAKCNLVRKDFCVDGAICKAFRSKRYLQGVCRCQSGTKGDSERTCKTQVDIDI